MRPARPPALARFAAGLLALAALCGPAAAEISVDSAPALRRAVREAPAGETIALAPGRYDIADLKIPRSLSLVGRGEVVLTSSQPVAKGLLNPLPGASLSVAHITFRGAASPDLNGAGIRHDGADLAIADCRFEENENGVLATGDPSGNIQVTDSVFVKNGHGDGYSHGFYLSSGASLTIRASAFIGTRAGHHVKSLAGETLIADTTFDDADGEPSYALDASKGGAVRLYRNSFFQAADAANATIINYDLSRGGRAVLLELRENSFVNRRKNARLLRNGTTLAPVAIDNIVQNEDGGFFTDQSALD